MVRASVSVPGKGPNDIDLSVSTGLFDTGTTDIHFETNESAG
jgi:hypothetical protein